MNWFYQVRKLTGRSSMPVRLMAGCLILKKHKDYADRPILSHKIITHEKQDKNKIYSIRKPFTDSISKGRAHKKHEFGNKIGFLTHPKNLIITEIDAFMGDPHDSKTIEPSAGRSEKILGKRYEQIIYDRGARGQSQIGETQFLTPKPPLKRDGIYQKK